MIKPQDILLKEAVDKTDIDEFFRQMNTITGEDIVPNDKISIMHVVAFLMRELNAIFQDTFGKYLDENFFLRKRAINIKIVSSRDSLQSTMNGSYFVWTESGVGFVTENETGQFTISLNLCLNIPYIQRIIFLIVDDYKNSFDSNTLLTACESNNYHNSKLLKYVSRNILKQLKNTWKKYSLPAIKRVLAHELTHVMQIKQAKPSSWSNQFSTAKTAKTNLKDYMENKQEIGANALEVAKNLQDNGATLKDFKDKTLKQMLDIMRSRYPKILKMHHIKLYSGNQIGPKAKNRFWKLVYYYLRQYEKEELHESTFSLDGLDKAINKQLNLETRNNKTFTVWPTPQNNAKRHLSAKRTIDYMGYLIEKGYGHLKLSLYLDLKKNEGRRILANVHPSTIRGYLYRNCTTKELNENYEFILSNKEPPKYDDNDYIVIMKLDKEFFQEDLEAYNLENGYPNWWKVDAVAFNAVDVGWNGETQQCGAFYAIFKNEKDAQEFMHKTDREWESLHGLTLLKVGLVDMEDVGFKSMEEFE